MSMNSLVTETERGLQALSADLTAIRPGECLLCYVYRMLEVGCVGLRWSGLYRDERAPRATALERRLGEKGGYCDCEIFLNAYELAPQHWVVPEPFIDENGFEVEEDPSYPDPMPVCRGVRRGSTQGCALWVRRWRGGW
jgi:hypothetical protein